MSGRRGAQRAGCVTEQEPTTTLVPVGRTGNADPRFACASVCGESVQSGQGRWMNDGTTESQIERMGHPEPAVPEQDLEPAAHRQGATVGQPSKDGHLRLRPFVNGGIATQMLMQTP